MKALHRKQRQQQHWPVLFCFPLLLWHGSSFNLQALRERRLMRARPPVRTAAVVAAASPAEGVASTLNKEAKRKIAIVGGGLSGLLCGYVLSQRHDVTVFEASTRHGGMIHHIEDEGRLLSVGHATHMGLFLNMRQLIQHLGLEQVPVGLGPNTEKGIFRMFSSTRDGRAFQPPLSVILSPSIWMEGLRFFFLSYVQAGASFGSFFREGGSSSSSSSGHRRRGGNKFSPQFVALVAWAVKTFEFDKSEEMLLSLDIGVCRSLLITQVFFRYLVLDLCEGRLPSKIDAGILGLYRRLAMERAPPKVLPLVLAHIDGLEQGLKDKTGDPLAAYYVTDYTKLADGLKEGCEERGGEVRLGAEVGGITRGGGGASGAAGGGGGGGGGGNGSCLTVHYSTPSSSSGVTVTAEEEHFDDVILSIHPHIARSLLSPEEAAFEEHRRVLGEIQSDAVTVTILRPSSSRWPAFPSPPVSEGDAKEVKWDNRHEPVFGLFDVSEISPPAPEGLSGAGVPVLSVSYPRGTPHHGILLGRALGGQEGKGGRDGARVGDTAVGDTAAAAGGDMRQRGVAKGSGRGGDGDRPPQSRTEGGLGLEVGEGMEQQGAGEEGEGEGEGEGAGIVASTSYPWVRATPAYRRVREAMMIDKTEGGGGRGLNGKSGIHYCGHTLSATNKASEIQALSALQLCYKHFGVAPPWGWYFPASVPDCNDSDAFQSVAGGPLGWVQALSLSLQGVVSTFLLPALLYSQGVEVFEDDD